MNIGAVYGTLLCLWKIEYIKMKNICTHQSVIPRDCYSRMFDMIFSEIRSHECTVQSLV